MNGSYFHSPHRTALVKSVARVVCPTQPEIEPLLGEIVHHTELSIRAFPTPARIALLAAMSTYDLTAQLFPFTRGTPARNLRGAVAERYFKSWWNSKLAPCREFSRGFKGLICLAFYEMPVVKEHLGYTPDAWIKKVTHTRLTTYAEAIANREQAIIESDPLGSFPLTNSANTNSANKER